MIFSLKKNKEKKKNKETDKNHSEKICSMCQIGEESYLLDEHSEFCPYIDALTLIDKDSDKYECPFFKKKE